jgi:hypothetical protein
LACGWRGVENTGVKERKRRARRRLTAAESHCQCQAADGSGWGMGEETEAGCVGCSCFIRRIRRACVPVA